MMYRSAHTVLLALMLLSGAVVRSATLSEVQSQVFDASCTGCHSGSSPSQGLNLSEGAAYGNTVNVPSTEIPSLNLVEPNDADNSYLMQKLEGTAQSGQQMPYGGPYLNSTLRQLVRDWIDAGAQNITTDTDGDGLEDDSDNCASVANAEQLDTDSDGLGNACDDDDDGDGVADTTDAFSLDSEETTDTDGDGTGNNEDTDDDGDTILDTADVFPLISIGDETDTDADGAPNTCDASCLAAGMTADTDDDGDGIADTTDAFPLDASEQSDSDGDGTGDNADVFPLDATETLDTDHDGLGNNADTDDDGDAVSDAQEALDGTDPLDRYNCNGCFDFDIDLDGETAALTDGLLVLRHLFGFSGATLTEGAVTSSATRSDADTIASYLDTNKGHLDIDGDGSTEALTDGLLLLRYLFGFDGATLIEGAVGTDAPRTAADEIKTYFDARIEAFSGDIDGDGVSDSQDAFPLDDSEAFDTDGDGLGNNADTDDDGDGVVDAVDAFPLDATEVADSDGDGIGDNADPDTPTFDTNVGHPVFASPHTKPIVINGSYVYVTNTPSDTVDVVAIASEQVVARIDVGIDPVGLAVRPDGNEVWVANHVSDSVSVIDTDPDSATFHQVIATIQDIDAATLSTRFDEPVGIAFASNTKAYVTLSPSNQVAIVSGESYSVTGHLPIRAQDPRAITVQGNRLFVIPFESNNQSQLSGCTSEKIDGDVCTFDAVEHVFSNNNVLSVNYDADIIKNPLLPDRDLYIFNTADDTLLEVVNTVGTLLYGIAVDSGGRVFVSQTDARNTANGRAGTEKDGLEEMENRAFLNQVTMVDCQGLSCSEPVFYDLEPLPPSHPEPGMGLATPFGIQVSEDDSTLIVTAAGSDKLFTMDANTGEVLGRTTVGSVPRGVALLADGDGKPTQGWVLNTVGNTVSVVDLTSLGNPTLKTTITMNDPTDAEVKKGRIAFNDANASSTGTFSCESCHPDGGTDQLIWVLQTPICDVDGCTQIPPRLTMPIRGLRDTTPYHWDGIPGDPFGGNNTQSINSDVEPNCSLSEPETCTRFLVDGSMATTMCDVTNCPENDEGKLGLLSGERRDAMAKFLLSVPFPPSQTRPITNQVTQQAKDGFFEFNFVKDCGNCHKMPFLVSTNTGGTGMDAPTWRGAYDRWMVTPQARLNIIDLMNLVGMDDSFPERDMWILAGATPQIWEMVVQGSTGFSGAFGRQVTLNEASANLAETATMLDYLERAAMEGSIVLQAEGAQTSGGSSTPLELGYVDGRYVVRDSANPEAFSREELVTEAANGAMVLTLTGRLGPYVDFYNYPQPALWNDTPIQEQTGSVEVAFLSDARTLRMKGRHVRSGATVFVDGQRVEGQIRCETGSLPNCDNEIVLMEIDEIPEAGGMYLVQVQNPGGLFSNDALVYSDLRPVPARSGNLIESGGTFDEWDESWGTTLLNGSVRHTNGMVQFDVDTVSSNQPWRVQLFHRIWLVADQEYTFCYRARTTGGSRMMTAYLDAGADGYANISNGQRQVTIDASFKQFSHTVTIGNTDTSARIAFDMAQSTRSVQLDDIGIYEGDSCGTP
ncbi:MAG: hypothetical protein MK316_08860 [Pseudomonadales bacterium]|nr:hypothetical protein [Pseudomonadales bacterium]